MLSTLLLQVSVVLLTALPIAIEAAPGQALGVRNFWKWHNPQPKPDPWSQQPSPPPPNPNPWGLPPPPNPNPGSQPWGGNDQCNDNPYTTCLYFKNKNRHSLWFWPEIEGNNVANANQIAQDGEQDYVISPYGHSGNNLKITIAKTIEIDLCWTNGNTKLDVSLVRQSDDAHIAAYFLDRYNQRKTDWIESGGKTWLSYDTSQYDLKTFKFLVEVRPSDKWHKRAEIEGR